MTASPTAPTRSTRSRSCRWPPTQLGRRTARARRRAAATGQIARLAHVGSPASRWRSASIRRGTRSAWPRSGPGRPAYARAGADGLPFADGSFDAVVACLVFEHIDAVDDGDRRGRPGPRAGRPLLLLPQPPAAADARQRLDRRPDPRSARAVLADRSLPHRGGDDRGGRARRAHPLRPPPASRYVNALAAHGLLVERMVEPAPPPGFLALATEYADAATVPRLLYLRAR